MRIIAGQWRGLRLASVGTGDAAAHLRPTTDRTRESLFNILANAHGDPVTNARVLDVFAGTGALGWEALSRGAAALTAIEQGRKAQTIWRANQALFDGAGHLIARDARRPGAGTPHDLVFLDPPYGKAMGEAALDALITNGWLADGAFIVWEDSTPPTLPSGMTQIDQRRYGDTLMTFCIFESKHAP